MMAFELTLLNALGYGLDLKQCARTGNKEDLCYVSPRTGRAVSRQGAGPYAPRLLPLPPFFHTLLEEGSPDMDLILTSDLQSGFALTEFFFLRHCSHHRNFELPYARAFFIRESLRLWEGYGVHRS
jgi:DNA repair protein RecO (recombination protein O)